MRVMEPYKKMEIYQALVKSLIALLYIKEEKPFQ